MPRTASRLDRLERRHPHASADDAVTAMTDSQLLRNLARLRWGVELVHADEDACAELYKNNFVNEVDSLVAAGDLDGAWRILEERPDYKNEVHDGK